MGGRRPGCNILFPLPRKGGGGGEVNTFSAPRANGMKKRSLGRTDPPPNLLPLSLCCCCRQTRFSACNKLLFFPAKKTLLRFLVTAIPIDGRGVGSWEGGQINIGPEGGRGFGTPTGRDKLHLSEGGRGEGIRGKNKKGPRKAAKILQFCTIK